MKQSAWTLFLALFIYLFVASFIGTSSADNRITAAEAITIAKRFNGSEWQIAFLSNTGVTESVLSRQFNIGDQALMLPDGSAGQWVIESFKDTPKAISEKGKKKNVYPFRRLIVSEGQKTTVFQEIELALPVPQRLFPLKPEYIAALDDARKLAIAKTKAKFDRMSARSEVTDTGETSWKFRFYHSKSEDIVDKINISPDGKKQLPW